MKALLLSALFGCFALACGREELAGSTTPTMDPTATASVNTPSGTGGVGPGLLQVKVGPITDTHIHMWTLPRSAPPMSDGGNFPGSSPRWLAVNAMMPDYERSQGGKWVDHAVLIESLNGVSASKIVAANQWMLDQLKTEPKLLSVVGSLDVLGSPAQFTANLDQLASDKHFVGIRISGSDLFSHGQLKANARTNLSDLATRGILVDALDATGQQVTDLAHAVPSLRILLEHVAQKSPDFGVDPSWRASLELASAQPNVYLKISDTGRWNSGSVADSWSTPFASETDPAKYSAAFEVVWSLFGEDRLVFGSNWPVSNVAGDFSTEINVLETFLAGKGAQARNKVMNDNALKIYAPRP